MKAKSTRPTQLAAPAFDVSVDGEGRASLLVAGMEVAPEGRVDLKAQYGNRGLRPVSSAKSVSVPDFLTWKPVRAAGGLVDLDKHVGRVEWAVAYAYAEIQSPKAQSVFFGFGSDDGIVVWLNGKKILSHDVPRGVSPDSDTAKLELQPGENKLLLKI